MNTLTDETDLGHGWSAARYDDGTMVVWGNEERIELGADSVARLRRILAEAEEATPAVRRRRCRSFIYGTHVGLDRRVYAHLREPGSKLIEWSVEVPSPEHDILDGEYNDENRAIFNEVRDNAPLEVLDISETTISGPRLDEMKTADHYGEMRPGS